MNYAKVSTFIKNNMIFTKYINKISVFIAAVLVFAFIYLLVLNTEQGRNNNPELFKLGKDLALNGRNKTEPCSVCHGKNGEGSFIKSIPRLAGLHPNYIKKQLEDFARNPLDIGVTMEPISRDYNKTPRGYQDLTIYSPGIRKDDAMNNIAKILTKKEISALSEYYSNLSFIAKPNSVDFQTLERGRDIALRGKPEYLMPRCSACHGPNGDGFGEHFPPLAGQPEGYIISQINKWQRGERDNDHLSMMKNVANLLTDADKINVALYYSNMSYSVNLD